MPLAIIIINFICICRYLPLLFCTPSGTLMDMTMSIVIIITVMFDALWYGNHPRDMTQLYVSQQSMWVDGLMEKCLGWHKANLVNIQLPSCEPRQRCHPSRNHLIITIRQLLLLLLRHLLPQSGYPLLVWSYYGHWYRNNIEANVCLCAHSWPTSSGEYSEYVRRKISQQKNSICNCYRCTFTPMAKDEEKEWDDDVLNWILVLRIL